MKHIKYPKTLQFRNIVSNISRVITFVGLDENGDAMYDPTIKKPTLTFRGTVKLHGTNAGISYNNENGIYTQSRNNTFTLDKTDSHMGFTFFVKSKMQVFQDLFNKIAEEHGIDTDVYTITVYGEWAGKGVQKTVAISELEKAFYMFGIKISKPNDPDFNSYWLPIDSYLFDGEDRIWNITEFTTYEVDVDFNMPQLAQNKFLELTTAVGDECPVAKHFGVSGIGEGIVWTVNYKDTNYRFKTKDERHAGKSKVKTVKKVDNEKLQKIVDVANKVTPVWRLNQMFNEATDHGKDIDRKHLGTYIRMVIKDVMEEDLDIINDAGLEPKDINKYVSQYAREYFFEQETL